MSTATLDFSALEQSHWNDTERSNAETMSEFMQLVMNEHDFDGLVAKYEDEPYVQRNRAIPQGIPGLAGYVGSLVKRFPGYSYDVKKIVASGDLVVFHSHVTLREKDRGNQKKGLIIFDMWRLENGRIMEHWDAVQPLDFMMRLITLAGGGAVRNDNEIF